MSVDEICENTKMGREFAILGNYETSMVYYQGVLQQIQKLMTTVHEPEKKHLWQTVSGIVLFRKVADATCVLYRTICMTAKFSGYTSWMSHI